MAMTVLEAYGRITNENSFKNIVSILPKNADVYTSNLSRTIKTFNATVEEGLIYRKHIIDSRLVEQNLGVYSGIKYNELESLIKKKNFLKMEVSGFHMSKKYKIVFTGGTGRFGQNCCTNV